jgi:hypothetical protein
VRTLSFLLNHRGCLDLHLACQRLQIGQEPASSDLASYAPDGATVLEQVEAAIAANGVMVIATSRCPFW